MWNVVVLFNTKGCAPVARVTQFPWGCGRTEANFVRLNNEIIANTDPNLQRKGDFEPHAGVLTIENRLDTGNKSDVIAAIRTNISDVYWGIYRLNCIPFMSRFALFKILRDFCAKHTDKINKSSLNAKPCETPVELNKKYID